jgi:hypothetical protein
MCLILAGFFCSCAALVGCGAPSEVPQTEIEIHLKALSVFYGRYLSQNRGKTPPNEEALKKFIKALPPTELEAMKVTDVDSLFVSPRDKQPYLVKYSINLPPPQPQGAPVIAHETTGDGGKRYVATSLGDVQLVDDATFQKMTAQ